MMGELDEMQARQALDEVRVRRRQVASTPQGHWWFTALTVVAVGALPASSDVPSVPVQLMIQAGALAVLGLDVLGRHRPQWGSVLGFRAPVRDGYPDGRLLIGVVLILGVGVITYAVGAAEVGYENSLLGLGYAAWLLCCVHVLPRLLQRFRPA